MQCQMRTNVLLLLFLAMIPAYGQWLMSQGWQLEVEVCENDPVIP